MKNSEPEETETKMHPFLQHKRTETSFISDGSKAFPASGGTKPAEKWRKSAVHGVGFGRCANSQLEAEHGIQVLKQRSEEVTLGEVGLVTITITLFS